MLSVADSSLVRDLRSPISYARIAEKSLQIPNLIELQLESFDWFVDKGLRELFDEISPIKDFTGKVMELQFLDYEFGDPKYSELECRTRDLTFSRAALRAGRAPDQGDGRDPAPARLHGRLPVDDGPGHVHHQRRRARRREPARPLAGRLLQRSSRTRPPAATLFTRQGHPEPRRLARVRDAATRTSSRSRSTASARSRPPRCCAPSATSATTRSPASSRAVDTDPEHQYIASTRSTRTPRRRAARRSSRSTRSCARATRRPATTPASSSRACSSTSAATTSAASAATSSTRSWTPSRRGWASSCRARTRPQSADDHPRGHRRHRRPPDRAQQRPRHSRTTSTTSATAASAPSAS